MPVVITAYTEEHRGGVVDLIIGQERRYEALDERVRPPHTLQEIAQQIEAHISKPGVNSAGLVAVDGSEVKGFVVAQLLVSPPDSQALTFFMPREGVAQLLTLPDPAEADALAITNALFDALHTHWAALGAMGANFTRLSSDQWVAPLLVARGWSPIAVNCLRPSGPLPAKSSPPRFRVRPAREEDEDTLVALHMESLEFHARHDSTVNMAPGAGPGFREWIASMWPSKQAEGEAEALPWHAFVVDFDDVPAAMTTTYSYTVGPEQPGVYRAGLYCHIGSTAVRGDMRGKGLGSALVAGVLDYYEPLGVLEYTLWYHLRNPLSSAFWPRLGWEPMLTRYVWRTGMGSG